MPPSPDILDQLDYDQLGRVRHPLRTALHAEDEFPITFFHLGGLFRKPVRIFSLSGGEAREVLYSKTLFESPSDHPARLMPDGVGFAGFRLHDAKLPQSDRQAADWAAFLGASYFRSSGDEGQYGISARGIAIDTIAPGPNGEEFPDFSRFYIGSANDGAIEIFALLDGPSLTGAYRFVVRKRPTVTMDVHCNLFFRRDIKRVGIAPATSMYYYSETYRYAGIDYRPEVHDSDGLALWTAGGEQIWRPLNNPISSAHSEFGADSPQGFGLLQRDRSYRNYLDPVHYQRRPHLWIEPLDDWGRGSVHLLELPATGEYHDNVVAFWSPAQRVKAGEKREFRYRLSWGAKEPMTGGIGRCVATRLDRGSASAGEGKGNLPAKLYERTFLVEFDGKALDGKDPTQSRPVLTLERGTYHGLSVWPDADGSSRPWRVSFSVRAHGEEPLEMRLFLMHGEETVTETWAFQYHPAMWA